VKRREFITLLGSTAVAWPLASRAQPQPMPVMGYLSAASPESVSHRMAVFREGLAETGYLEGRNVAIEYLWAESNRLRRGGLKKLYALWLAKAHF
jgi:putative ABC transport system substrate-binding protein